MKRRNIIYNDYRGQVQSENCSMVMIGSYQDYMQHKANIEARHEMTDVLGCHRLTECRDHEYSQDSDVEMAVYILSSRDNLDFRERFCNENSGRN